MKTSLANIEYGIVNENQVAGYVVILPRNRRVWLDGCSIETAIKYAASRVDAIFSAFAIRAEKRVIRVGRMA